MKIRRNPLEQVDKYPTVLSAARAPWYRRAPLRMTSIARVHSACNDKKCKMQVQTQAGRSWFLKVEQGTWALGNAECQQRAHVESVIQA